MGGVIFFILIGLSISFIMYGPSTPKIEISRLRIRIKVALNRIKRILKIKE